MIRKLVSNKVLRKLKKSLLDDKSFRENYKKFIDPDLGEEVEAEEEISDDDGLFSNKNF